MNTFYLCIEFIHECQNWQQGLVIMIQYQKEDDPKNKEEPKI